MQFSSLTDPVDLARAEAAFDSVWNEIRPNIIDADRERERRKLACIVAGLILIADDERMLAARALMRYRRAAA